MTDNGLNDDYDYLSAIMAFENGELDESATIELFQYLVDTGMAWELQGAYGRTAQALIDSGLVTR
jgi:hypothetical protein